MTDASTTRIDSGFDYQVWAILCTLASLGLPLLAYELRTMYESINHNRTHPQQTGSPTGFWLVSGFLALILVVFAAALWRRKLWAAVMLSTGLGMVGVTIVTVSWSVIAQTASTGWIIRCVYSVFGALLCVPAFRLFCNWRTMKRERV